MPDLLRDRDISSGTFKIWDVAGVFQQAFEALSHAAASPMQAGRALDVLFDTQAAQARRGAQQLRPPGVGYKRPREGWMEQHQHGLPHRYGGSAGLPLPPNVHQW